MQTMTRHCDLSRVHAVGPCRGGTEIAFENGRTGFVPAGTARRGTVRRQRERGLRERRACRPAAHGRRTGPRSVAGASLHGCFRSSGRGAPRSVDGGFLGVRHTVLSPERSPGFRPTAPNPPWRRGDGNTGAVCDPFPPGRRRGRELVGSVGCTTRRYAERRPGRCGCGPATRRAIVSLAIQHVAEDDGLFLSARRSSRCSRSAEPHHCRSIATAVLTTSPPR